MGAIAAGGDYGSRGACLYGSACDEVLFFIDIQSLNWNKKWKDKPLTKKQYDKLIKKNIIRSAFEAADKLGMQCVGFDYVVDQRSGKGYIIEMCYGFDFKAIFDCGGYWDRNLVWHQKSLNIPLEVVKKLVE